MFRIGNNNDRISREKKTVDEGGECRASCIDAPGLKPWRKTKDCNNKTAEKYVEIQQYVTTRHYTMREREREREKIQLFYVVAMLLYFVASAAYTFVNNKRNLIEKYFPTFN